jgi:hypothetical protein
VERDQIHLDDPVDEILPELARPQIIRAVVSSDDGGAASQGFSLVSAKVEYYLEAAPDAHQWAWV